MGHSNISLCLACNTALTRASIPLFGNETTSSISHGLCAGRDLSDWAKILNQSQLGDEEDSCICKDAGKIGKGDPHDSFLTTVLAEKRRFFLAEEKLWVEICYSNTKKKDDNFLSLVICTKFACNHSINEVSLRLDILNEEHGRVILGEQRNRIKRNGIRDRQKKRAIHYSPPRVFRLWMWKQMSHFSSPTVLTFGTIITLCYIDGFHQ